MTRSIWKRYEKRLIRFDRTGTRRNAEIAFHGSAENSLHARHALCQPTDGKLCDRIFPVDDRRIDRLIAMINFVNFTVSRIPSRIRHINTQKILGETNARLRLRSIAESVVLSLVSLFLALLLARYLSTTRVASLVDASIDPLSNLRLIFYGRLALARCGIYRSPVPCLLQHVLHFRTQRIVRPFTQRKDHANHADIVSVRRFDRADHNLSLDRRAKPIHKEFRYGIQTGQIF